MYWNKNKKKYIVIIFGGILILVILCLGDYGIRYYNAPIEKDYKYIGTGMLVRFERFYEWRISIGRDAGKDSALYLGKSRRLYSGERVAKWRKNFRKR